MKLLQIVVTRQSNGLICVSEMGLGEKGMGEVMNTELFEDEDEVGDWINLKLQSLEAP